MEAKNLENCYLVVDEYNEVLCWYESRALANYSLKYRYQGCRVVPAVCETFENGECSPWSCGRTITEAKKNYSLGIFDNWANY